jgi:hypothetical protein
VTGLFLGADAPSEVPEPLDFSENALGSSFQRLAPQLGQPFFIGDGLTGTGTEQSFLIPAGATHLYLGFSDGWVFQGEPSWYGDNTGSVPMRVTQKM